MGAVDGGVRSIHPINYMNIVNLAKLLPVDTNCNALLNDVDSMLNIMGLYSRLLLSTSRVPVHESILPELYFTKILSNRLNLIVRF
jgi:hypothetical protein